MRHILRRWVACALAFLSLSGCASGAPQASPGAPDETLPAQSETMEPTQQPLESPSAAPTVQPSAEPEPSAEPYRFGQPVAEGDAVEEDWFADAAFLGDSRTEGLQLFSGLRTGDFFWYKGMTVFKADDPEYRKVEVDGQHYTLLEALALKRYAKVYIMIGINELGYAASSYKKGLAALVERVKEIQPEAVVYLQTLPPVNETVAAEKKLGSYINNKNVNAFNRAIWQVAWEEEAALLDVASVFRSERGDLPADMAADGVHFYRKGYALWYEYLRGHTLTAQEYAAGVPLEETPEPSFPPLLPPETQEPGETAGPDAPSAPSQTPTPEPSPDAAESPALPPEPSPDPDPSSDPGPSPDPAPSAAVSSDPPGPLIPEPSPGLAGGEKGAYIP